MTLTEPAALPERSLQGGLLARCRRSAANLLTVAASDSQRVAASSAAPRSDQLPVTGGIAAEDWDVLFRAALEFLERVAVERAAPSSRGRQLQVPDGTALRECLAALDQLRRSVPPRPPV